MNIKKNIMAHIPHQSLSSRLWANNKMKKDMRNALLNIAYEFIDYLGISIDVIDITITGSYANYNYTPYSDIDLHVIIDFDSIGGDLDLVEEFFNAKKSFWNDRHDIELRGIEIELYPQNSKEEHSSTGVYSVLNNEWIVEPKRFKTDLDVDSLTKKSKIVRKEIAIAMKNALESNNIIPVKNIIKKIRKMRISGLEKAGELSDENIIYKVIRNSGDLQKLFNLKDKLLDLKLSKI